MTWSHDDEIRLIMILEEENVVVTPHDVCEILRKLDDPDDPDQDYFRKKIAS